MSATKIKILAMMSAWVAVEGDAEAGDVEIALAAEVLEAVVARAAKVTGAGPVWNGWQVIRAGPGTGPGNANTGAQACAEAKSEENTTTLAAVDIDEICLCV